DRPYLSKSDRPTPITRKDPSSLDMKAEDLPIHSLLVRGEEPVKVARIPGVLVAIRVENAHHVPKPVDVPERNLGSGHTQTGQGAARDERQHKVDHRRRDGEHQEALQKAPDKKCCHSRILITARAIWS